jgi:hypothetical protein
VAAKRHNDAAMTANTDEQIERAVRWRNIGLWVGAVLVVAILLQVISGQIVFAIIALVLAFPLGYAAIFGLDFKQELVDESGDSDPAGTVARVVGEQLPGTRIASGRSRKLIVGQLDPPSQIEISWSKGSGARIKVNSVAPMIGLLSGRGLRQRGEGWAKLVRAFEAAGYTPAG